MSQVFQNLPAHFTIGQHCCWIYFNCLVNKFFHLTPLLCNYPVLSSTCYFLARKADDSLFQLKTICKWLYWLVLLKGSTVFSQIVKKVRWHWKGWEPLICTVQTGIREVFRRNSNYWHYTRGSQTCSMYESHIAKPKLQRAATLKSKNTNLFAICASVAS